ncbi:MAG: ribosomal protein S18-alanine N-acetyltransferase [Candidatus Thorarchaeota archaeon]|jgi:ribosomal-protein-alanine N-acetyltransferase
MTVAYTIRLFEKEDIDAVMEINQVCLPENYPGSFFLGLHSHAPKAFLVAEIESRVIGYIMCRIERGISSFRRPYPVKKGHIVSVAVLRDYRRHGIGTHLIQKGMEGMEQYGASEFYLEVRKTNTQAVSVYEKMNYEVSRVLRGYYRDGEDAYLMTKQKESEPEDEDSND